MIQKQQKTQKQKTKEQFQKIFADSNNASCLFCERNCKQWVQTRHMIFLCLNCASRCQDIPRVANIKSVNVDYWSQLQLQMIKIGGNAKFMNFIKEYDLQRESPQAILTSKAAQFYRLYLLNPTKLSLNDAPQYQQGRVNTIQIPLGQVSSNLILQQAKQKLSFAGETTLYYGGKAYEKISNTLTTGLHLQNAQITEKVSETAKTIWSFVSTKINQIQNKQNQLSHI